jgi:hypothetical protein
VKRQDVVSPVLSIRPLSYPPRLLPSMQKPTHTHFSAWVDPWPSWELLQLGRMLHDGSVAPCVHPDVSRVQHPLQGDRPVSGTPASLPRMSEDRCTDYCLGIEAILAAVIGTLDGAQRRAILEELGGTCSSCAVPASSTNSARHCVDGEASGSTARYDRDFAIS